MMTTTNPVCFGSSTIACECDRCEARRSAPVVCACCQWRDATDLTGDEPLCEECSESAS